MKKVLSLILVVVALQLSLVSATYAAPAAWGNEGGMYHTVRYGETLYSIGRHYGVSPHKIARVNGLHNPNYIYAGQVLYIPSGGGYNPYPDDGRHNPGGSSYHKVKYGETLYSIGRLYGVSSYKIAEANNLYNPNYIYAGQKLYIPSGGGWGYSEPCQSNCYGQDHSSSYYGYDYTGYYYVGHYPQQKQYSYTCGYYHNCW